MKTLRVPGWVLLAGVVAAASMGGEPAVPQVSTYPTFVSEVTSSRVRRRIGMSVENRDGIKLGTVKDFVADLQTGQINYAILSTAGLLGLHAQLSIVPAQALSSATVKKRTVALDISTVRWKDAPRFRKKDLQLLGERTREVQIYQFYGLPVPGPKAGRGTGARPKGDLRLASALIGRTVTGREGESLGRISDLLLDPGGQRPALAIITSLESSPGRRTYAVPLRLLSQAGSDRIRVDATRATFERAQAFTPKAWQTAGGGSDAVYWYE
jgi:sporulation protein YlmC with PRC-barrel domain